MRIRSQIAQAWGCSRPYVSKCIAQGCPIDSVEAATAWRVAHSKEGMGHKSKHGKPLAPAAPTIEVETKTETEFTAEQISAGDIEAMALRARESEQQAYAALRDLQSLSRGIDPAGKMTADELADQRQSALGLVPGALRSYTQASKVRLDVEKKLAVVLEERGKLVRVDTVWEQIQDILLPVIDSLKQLPKLTAKRASPDNPMRAEAAITEEVNIILRRMQTVIERAGRAAKEGA